MIIEKKKTLQAERGLARLASTVTPTHILVPAPGHFPETHERKKHVKTQSVENEKEQ